MHLKTVFGTVTSSITVKETFSFGCDQEKALMNAIEFCFPDTKLVLCSRHLKDNVGRYLSEKIGMKAVEVSKAKSKIFNNLLESNGVEEFDNQKIEILREISTDENGKKYLSSVIDTIKKYVFEKSPMVWTNNNCESLNHVIKSFTSWEILKPSSLINELEILFNCQMNDIRKAFVGEGNFYIAGNFSKSLVSREIWVNMNKRQQMKRILKIFGDITKDGTIKSNQMKSTDGKLILNRIPSLARKPGQKKRVKACKTTIINYK